MSTAVEGEVVALDQGPTICAGQRHADAMKLKRIHFKRFH
jgi:hypothetical protein